MNKSYFKSFFSHTILSLVLTILSISLASQQAYAKTHTIKVQKSYTADDLFQIITPQFKQVKKEPNNILVIANANLTIFAEITNKGTMLRLLTITNWKNRPPFSINYLNKINRNYGYARAYLNDEALNISMEIDIGNVSKAYILKQIQLFMSYNTLVMSQLTHL